jgi:hypothetical protein
MSASACAPLVPADNNLIVSSRLRVGYLLCNYVIVAVYKKSLLILGTLLLWMIPCGENVACIIVLDGTISLWDEQEICSGIAFFFLAK